MSQHSLSSPASHDDDAESHYLSSHDSHDGDADSDLASTITYPQNEDANPDSPNNEEIEPFDLPKVQGPMLSLLLMERHGTLPSQPLSIIDRFIGTSRYDRRWVHPVSLFDISNLVDDYDGNKYKKTYAFGKGWVLDRQDWDDLFHQLFLPNSVVQLSSQQEDDVNEMWYTSLFVGVTCYNSQFNKRNTVAFWFFQ